MYIYLIQNSINDKKYIGQTIKPIQKRWNSHIYASKNGQHSLARAMKKHGTENFSIMILEEYNSTEELNMKEKEYIEKFDTYKNGYNDTLGGNEGCTIGYRHSEKAKIVMSELKKGKTFRRNYSHSDETKEKIRQKRIEMVRNGLVDTGKGKPKSEEARQNMSKAKKGKPNYRSRKTYEITHPDGTIEIVNGLQPWCELKGLHSGNMVSVSKGKLKHYKGYTCRQIG